MGYDLGIGGEDIIHQAAIVGIERANIERFSARFDSLCQAFDFLVEVIFLDGAVMGAIHLDSLRLQIMAAEDAIDEVLEIVEAIAISANDRPALCGDNLQAWAIVSFLHLNGSGKAEVAEHGIEDLGC